LSVVSDCGDLKLATLSIRISEITVFLCPCGS
jgi:hypothetical protein